MSHTGQATCSIEAARADTLAEALDLVCTMHGGRKKPGNQVRQWGRRILEARGTVLEGLGCTFANTDVDVFIEGGKVRVVGDENSNAKVIAEVEKAYKAVAFQKVMRARGMQTTIQPDAKMRRYRIQAFA